MTSLILGFFTRKFALFYLILLITGNICAQNNELILNPNQPVDLSNFEQVNGIWNLVKNTFPDADIKFMYSSGKVDYVLFDLKHENSFLVFSSKPQATSFNLRINDLDSKEIKSCMVRHTFKNSKEVHNRFFGHLFQLEEGKTCEIVSEGEYNEGNLKFNITRDDKGLWLCSVIKMK
jgi:hypothetical protein